MKPSRADKPLALGLVAAFTVGVLLVFWMDYRPARSAWREPCIEIRWARYKGTDLEESRLESGEGLAVLECLAADGSVRWRLGK